MISEAQTIARWLAKSRSAVAFTGAGISTESGIPDFRSPGGVWSRRAPVYFQEFLESAEARTEYWRQKAESHTDFASAEPNVAHRALAKWESAGMLRGVVTQNIDGLHQLSGSRHVLELHGTAREIACLSCARRFGADAMVEQFVKTAEVPECPECGGLLKHATISFGQPLSPDVLEESLEWTESADLYLAVGSSLVVEPAASLPALAKRNGARLVIINRDSTPCDAIADLVINEAIGETITHVERSLEAFQSDSSAGFQQTDHSKT